MASLPTGALARSLAAPSVALAVSVAAAVGCTTTDSNVSASSEAPSATSSSGSTAGKAPGTTKAGSSPGTKRPTTTEGTTEETTEETTGDTTDTTDTSTDTATLPKACDLLTEADATKAFGEPAVAGDQRQDECWWSTANDLKTVNLIRRTGDIDDWRRGYQNDKWKKVDRGDEGYQGKVLNSIVWRTGDTTYEVNVVYSTKGDPEQVVQDLADTVQSRL